MRVESKRIFISDLPETVTKDELENAVKDYGNVTSIEIKERKELGIRNSSLFFAYINVEIDDGSLQQCFKDFARGKCSGHHISLQIARESFLDRLKRERESTGTSQNIPAASSDNQPQVIANSTPKLKQGKAQSEDETSESEAEEKPVIKTKKKSLEGKSNNLTQNGDVKDPDNDDEVIDMVIKSNKGKVVDRNGLKIESVGNSPIITIDKSKKKTPVNTSEANLRRLQSLQNLKKNHRTQISLVQRALAKIDNRSNTKVITDETVENKSINEPKTSIFDEDDDFELNFEAKKGKKLLDLQTQYNNDRRFVLDERFVDDDEDEDQMENHVENNEITLEDEKKKEYEILEQVLGKKVEPVQQKSDPASGQKSVMLRFDPTQPEHSKFELKNDAKKEKKKRKKVDSNPDLLSEKKREDTEAPEVSKEIFYKVTEDLKDSLKEKQNFSLLSMFGTAEEKEQVEEESATIKKTTKTNDFMKEKNPFRYDSSDDEDETQNVTNDTPEQVEKPQKATESKTKPRNIFWSEPFLFTEDDYRLQEGFDFIERMQMDEDEDFMQVRRNIKLVARAKVRNNLRNNRPFKKKLGGNKKKKMIRIKKALKR